jgi:hypothetical protein
MKTTRVSLILLVLLSSCFASAMPLGSLGLKKTKKSTIHKTSFEETQTRYLSPLDMAELFMERFPLFILDTNCDINYPDTDNSKSLRVLLGENKPATGEPDTLAPSAGLITKLKSCTDTALTYETSAIIQGAGFSSLYPTAIAKFKEIFPAELKKTIPCRAEFCAKAPQEWLGRRMMDLSSGEQKSFIRELLLKVWGTLKVYEEMNEKSADDLIEALQKQTAQMTLAETYKKVQLWAALRDEFLMF